MNKRMIMTVAMSKGIRMRMGMRMGMSNGMGIGMGVGMDMRASRWSRGTRPVI